MPTKKKVTKKVMKKNVKSGGFCVLGVQGKTDDGKEMHGDLKFSGPVMALMLISEAFKEGLRLVQADIHVKGKK